jgi:hypothetical protein
VDTKPVGNLDATSAKVLRRLLIWLGTPDDVINKLTLDVMRINEGVEVQQRKIDIPTFETVPLPPMMLLRLLTLQSLTSLVWLYLSIWLHVI